MNRRVNDSKSIVAKLNQQRGLLAGKLATVGFDGYVDDVVRVVESRADADHAEFIATIGRFSERIAAAAGISADLEIVSISSKLGGNAPIMANALASLGLQTSCIGAMGYPELHPVFLKLDGRCRICSICQPSTATALEFCDGKIMLAGIGPLRSLTWDYLKAIVGLDVLREEMRCADVVAMVNWSLLPGIGTIWEGLYREVFQNDNDRRDRLYFFDLADPGKRTAQDILGVLDIIGGFSKLGRTVLGLNENESRIVARTLGIKNETTIGSLEHLAGSIQEYANIGTVVIHAIDHCCCADGSVVATIPGKLVSRPSISTGGGDNFNAGFCAGYLLGFDSGDSCLLGMAVSGFYVKNGCSPSFEQWVSYLGDWDCRAESANVGK